MSARPCAIVGVGQTHHKTRRLDVSFGGMIRAVHGLEKPVLAAVMEWPRAKLVTEMCDRVPVRVPRRYESRTSQLSSTTTSPWRSATARMASQSGQLPTRLGVRIALVRGPIIASMAATSIWSVSGSTSTNAGTMPLRTSGAMSLENVSGDVITSSPGSHPSRSTASQMADVPLFTITACCLASTAPNKLTVLRSQRDQRMSG